VTIPANADAVAIAAKNMGFDLKAYIKEQIQTEINAMPAPTVSKHILDVIEDENTVTVVFAKHGDDMSMEEEGMKDEEEEMKGGHKDDEEEKGSDKKEEEDEEMKALVKALLSLEGDC
jgi:hypothetical protein